MLRSNAIAAAIATKFGVTAATDVTGFGLAGHLSEMLDQSNASATLDLASILVLTGAADCLARGVRSSLHADNVAAMSSRLSIHSAQGSCISCDDDVAAILFDPQTSGGLLLGVDPSRSAELVSQLKSCGDEAACVIGRVEA